MRIHSLDTDCFRIPLPRPLSDSTHGQITHFQLVTVRLRDENGVEGLGYTYTVGHGGVAIRSLVTADLAPLLIGSRTDDIEAA